MNIKALYIGCAAVALGGMFSSCSDSYLDVKPETDINESMLGDPSVAYTALEGVYESMNHPWEGIDFNQNVGEPYINYLMNDCTGNDLVSGLWNNPGNPGLAVWPRMGADNDWVAAFPWAYYYGIIGEANRIISAITATSSEGEVADLSLYFYKAGALTVRAHGYTRLLTYYGNRWEDSDNGNAYCIPLRLGGLEEKCPLSTMNQVLDQIYADLDEAIKLFDKSEMSRSEKYQCDKAVAYGIWARAALLKHDWRTAADKAELALKDFKVMTEKDLFAGFFSDNDDLIWGAMNKPEVVGYWSWGTHYACNGHYIQSWNFGGGSINIDLYNQLDKNDLRRKFFLTPDKIEGLSKRQNPGGIKPADFWNKDMVSMTNFCNLTGTSIYVKNNKGDGYGMVDAVANWLVDYRDNVFTGDKASIEPTDGFYNYFVQSSGQKNSKKSVKMMINGKQAYATPVNVPFGAQCKFWGEPPFATGMYPFMRASEMALTRAEALCELGDANAATVFEDFQKLRVPGYKCTSTGTALLEEIRISRRAELWGEGHNFTDLKRWNLRHEHREWVAGDPNSGNWPPGENLSEEMMSQKYSNGWRFAIPTRESRYNDAIDISLLPSIK